MSVGRGTGTPFELIGAPYIDDLRLAEAMNDERPARSSLCARSFHPVG
jgi:uncharacterized protein YbbC (DUF1343 family)